MQRFVPVEELFKGRHFDQEIVVLNVRWYVTYAASHRAVADLKGSGELPKRVKVRSCKYLNNIVEQDHRRVKQRLGPMLGLKSFPMARWSSEASNWQHGSRRVSS
jgi:transposase-like protein